MLTKITMSAAMIAGGMANNVLEIGEAMHGFRFDKRTALIANNLGKYTPPIPQHSNIIFS